MRVTAVNSLGQPFRERTCTLVVNSHGCKYPSKQKVKMNSWVTLEIAYLEVKRPPRSVRARVAWIQPRGTQQEHFHLGVELEAPGNVWGIAAPPDDWLTFGEPGALEIPAPGAKPLVTARATPPAPASVSDEEFGELSNPLGAEVAASLTQPVAWLVSEFREQIQKTVSEAAAAAAAAESSHLLGDLRTQLRDETKKTFEIVAASHTDQWVRRATEQMNEAHQASAKTLHAHWTRKMELDLRAASERLAARSGELNRRVDSLTVSAVERLQRLVEASQRDSMARFVSRLQQQLAPLLEPAQAALTKLAKCKEEVEQTSGRHRNWFEKTLQQSVLESAARMQETSGQLEKQFEQAIRDRLAEALEEIEQATNGLREKAAEILRLFAGELDDYSRSYREYISGLIAELAKETANRSRIE